LPYPSFTPCHLNLKNPLPVGCHFSRMWSVIATAQTTYRQSGVSPPDAFLCRVPQRSKLFLLSPPSSLRDNSDADKIAMLGDTAAKLLGI